MKIELKLPSQVGRGNRGRKGYGRRKRKGWEVGDLRGWEAGEKCKMRYKTFKNKNPKYI